MTDTSFPFTSNSEIVVPRLFKNNSSRSCSKSSSVKINSLSFVQVDYESISGDITVTYVKSEYGVEQTVNLHKNPHVESQSHTIISQYQKHLPNTSLDYTLSISTESIDIECHIPVSEPAYLSLCDIINQRTSESTLALESRQEPLNKFEMTAQFRSGEITLVYNLQVYDESYEVATFIPLQKSDPLCHTVATLINSNHPYEKPDQNRTEFTLVASLGADSENRTIDLTKTYQSFDKFKQKQDTAFQTTTVKTRKFLSPEKQKYKTTNSNLINYK
jgi:hypothetical protein